MRIRMQGSDDQKSENYIARKNHIFLLKNRKLYPYASLKDIQAT